MSDSMMNSHFQPARPATPSMPENIPAARTPERAWARTRPEYRIAVRRAISLRVYQQFRRYTDCLFLAVSKKKSLYTKSLKGWWQELTYTGKQRSLQASQEEADDNQLL